MRIQVLEKKLKDTDPFTGTRYDVTEGTELVVHDDYGARLCRLGWAKDLDGNVPTGERKEGVEVLSPKKAVSGVKSTQGGT